MSKSDRRVILFLFNIIIDLLFEIGAYFSLQSVGLIVKLYRNRNKELKQWVEGKEIEL